MATENFEAVIAANIRDFQRAMREVDQQIQQAALGANAPIDANITDFMSQMSQVDAQLDQLAADHTVDLDANISAFEREMRDVNRLLDDVSTGAIADIGAHTAEFTAALNLVNQHLNTVEAGANADIGANIVAFNAAMQEVEAQMLAAQAGADATITADIAGFIADMAIVDASLDTLAQDHNVNINANLTDFQFSMREVRRLLNDVDTGVIVNIGAHTVDFMAAIRTVDQHIHTVEAGASANIGADILAFNAAIRDVVAQMNAVQSGVDPVIDADIAGFLAEIALVDARLAELANDHNVIIIDADVDTSNVETTWARIRRLLNERIVIPVRTSWRNYQTTMGQIASFSRNMSEIMAMTARGIMISISPAIVPIIASIVGLLGQLGPMLGTIGGSTFALVTAFAAAGIGAAGFGAIAVTNLKDIFGASSDLKKLQEKLDDATTLKERTKIMKEMKAIQGSMNKEQTAALSSMGKLKDTWTGIAKGLETKTIQIFTQSLDIFGSVLKSLEPMFLSVTNAVLRLTKSMSQTIQSDSMKAFFDYLNTTAGPMLETISKSVGNFIKGFLNMMVAFGPLAADTADGFLKMSEGFAAWSAKLGESVKFQAFVDYVKENMPKIKSIFGDAIQGMINTFAAFAPSSADMMTSLQDMMARLKEWSSTLAENQGFQNFINYVKENGPRVVDLIGNITKFIVELGTAFAPTGAYMLDLINRFLEWSTAMMENHPLIGKIMAAVVVFGGALMAALPHVLGLVAALGTLTMPIGAAQVSMLSMAATFITKTAAMVASTVTAVATFIAKWTLMGAQALIHAAKVAAAWVLATGQAMVTAVASMATTAATFVAKWLLIGAQAMIHAAKVAAAWVLSTGTAMVTSLASMVATSAVFVAKWLWMGVQSLLHAAKMAAAWFIALGPIGWVTGAIVALAVLVIANWDKIKTKTKEIWTNISDAVKEAWQKVKEKTVEAVTELGKNIAKMPGKVTEFIDKMKQAGSDLISGVIKGITGKIGEGLDAIGGFAKSLLARFKKDTDTNSPSEDFANISKWFAPGVVKGIDKTSHLAINSVSGLADKVVNTFASGADVKAFTDKGADLGKGIASGITSTQSANQKAIVGVSKVLSAAARDNAAEIAKIDEDNEKKRTEIKSEYAKKRAELDRKTAQSSQTALKTSKNKKGEIVTTGTQRVHNIHANASAQLIKLNNDEKKKLAAANDKAWNAMVKKEAELSRAKLEAAKTYVADKKSLDQLSLAAESEIWRKSIVLFKEGTKERVEAQRAYQTTLATINDNIVKTNAEYAGKMSDVNSKLIKEEEDLTNTYVKSLDDRASSLTNFIGIFDFFEVKIEKTGGDLLNNLKSQVSGFVNWQREIESLANKAIDKGLIAELREMGPKALPELLALNSMTDTQLTEYSQLYQKKSELARQQAEKEMAPLKANTEKQIKELRGAANKELEILRVDWVNKIKLVTKGTDDEFSKMTRSMKSIGNDTISGLMSGIDNMKGPLMQQARDIADSVAATMRKALQVKSPSRVMEVIGEFLPLGLASGIYNTAGAVIKSVLDMANGITNAFNPQLAMPLMDLKMNPLDTSSQIDSLKRQIKQELSVDMSVKHSGGTNGELSSPSESNVYHVTIDAKNVKEFNNAVEVLGSLKQAARRG